MGMLEYSGFRTHKKEALLLFLVLCLHSSSVRPWEFIRNLDWILQNNFHLKSSFDKTKYIFDQSILKCNGHFGDWFSNTIRLFCVAYGICTGRNCIL